MLECRLQIGFRGLPRWADAKQQTGDERQQKGEGEYPPIELHLIQARDFRRYDLQQRAHAELCQRNPRRRSEH